MGRLGGKIAGKVASTAVNHVASAAMDKVWAAVSSNPNFQVKINQVTSQVPGLQNLGSDVSSLIPGMSGSIKADPNQASGLAGELKGAAQGTAKTVQEKAASMTAE